MCGHITPIIKVVEYCNYTCSFCRYPHNSHKSIMPFSTFRTIIEKVCEYNMSKGHYQISVIYHGGEPLLWGYNNFVSAIELQKELNKKYPKLVFSNSIQTNGSLLNDQWISFFKKNNFDIGVSVDGPEEINFHKGAQDNKVVLENIHKLSDSQCKFGVLSVITNNHDGYADKYYNFLIEHNIHSVGLCYCIYDENKFITVDNRILTNFLKRFFILYYEGEYRLDVREFTNIIKLSCGIKTGACTFSKRQQCGNFYSIRSNGDVFFCDPYSLNSSPIGNILKETFSEICLNPNLIEIIDSAKDSVLKECSNCEIKEICGGGCFRHCFGKNGNAFCETFKSLYPYVDSIVKSSINQIKANN